MSNQTPLKNPYDNSQEPTTIETVKLEVERTAQKAAQELASADLLLEIQKILSYANITFSREYVQRIQNKPGPILTPAHALDAIKHLIAGDDPIVLDTEPKSERGNIYFRTTNGDGFYGIPIATD